MAEAHLAHEARAGDELRERLDEAVGAVKNEETVEIVEKGRPIGLIRPIPTHPMQTERRKRGDMTVEQWLDHLVEIGAAKRGPRYGEAIPESFFTEPLPVAEKSVLDQLLEDRHHD